MTLTFVVRVAEQPSLGGEVVGRVELVSSGARATFHSLAELGEFLQRASLNPGPATEDPR